MKYPTGCKNIKIFAVEDFYLQVLFWTFVMEFHVTTFPQKLDIINELLDYYALHVLLSATFGSTGLVSWNLRQMMGKCESNLTLRTNFH